MILRFADYELDSNRYTLRRQGRRVAVQPRVLDLLLHLVSAGDRIVSREELHQAVWKGVVVSETALSYAMKEARRAIADDGHEQRLIQTVRGRGYRFVAPVSTLREPGAPTRRKPGASDPLVGRREILEVLESEIDAALSGSRRLVLIEGEPGIGKSRLLGELRDRALARGFRVLIGRGVEGVGAPACWPWTQALRDLLLADERPSLPPDVARVIAGTIPELRDLLPEAASGAPLVLPDAREARFRLFDALSRTCALLARQRPLLLAFDDLHRADPETLCLLDYVAREFERAPVIAIGTTRSAALVGDPERARQIGELLRGPHARVLQLAGLAPDDVALLVCALRGAAPSEEQLHDLMQRTGGNPFFIREVAAVRGSHGGAEDELPETVRNAVLRHLDALPARGRRLLARAAVLGRVFELEALAHLAGVAPQVALAELDRAVAARVVEAGEPGPSSYRFAHGLVPEALVGSIPVGELRRLHAAAAVAIADATGNASDGSLRIAEHLVRAVPEVDREVAIDACRQAARRLRERFAHGESAALLEQAVALASSGACDEALRLELLLELADAQIVAARLGAARGTCTRAAEIARRRGCAESLARAALAFADEQDDPRMDPEIVDMLEEARAKLPQLDSPLRARLDGRLAEALYHGPEMERAENLSCEAVAMARRCRDLASLGYTLKARHWSAWAPDNLEERETIAAELLQLAQLTRRPDLVHEALAFGISNALERGDREAMEAAFGAYADLARRERRLFFDWHLEHYRVMRLLLDGDVHAADLALQCAHQLGQQTHYHVAQSWFGIQLWGIRDRQGRLAELEPVMRELARKYPMTPWRVALTREDVSAGREEEGHAALRAFFGDGWDGLRRVRRDLSCLTTLWHLAGLCEQLGAAPEARLVEKALEPYAERHVVVGIGMLYMGPVAAAMASAARAQERPDDAQRYLAGARARDLRAEPARSAGPA